MNQHIQNKMAETSNQNRLHSTETAIVPSRPSHTTHVPPNCVLESRIIRTKYNNTVKLYKALTRTASKLTYLQDCSNKASFHPHSESEPKFIAYKAKQKPKSITYLSKHPKN